MVPVADVKTVADPQRMVAPRGHPVMPGIFLAARFPLAGYPPPPDFLRSRRIDEVEDHHDIADVPLDGRGDVGVAPVEIVAVHALAVGAPLSDRPRAGRGRDVVDPETTAELGVAAASEPLVIHDHHVAGNADLVRVPALRHVDGGQHFRMGRIADVDDGRAGRMAHVADVKGLPVDPYLSAAGTIDVADASYVESPAHDDRAVTQGARRRRRPSCRASGRARGPSTSARRSRRTRWPDRSPMG